MYSPRMTFGTGPAAGHVPAPDPHAGPPVPGRPPVTMPVAGGVRPPSPETRRAAHSVGTGIGAVFPAQHRTLRFETQHFEHGQLGETFPPAPVGGGPEFMSRVGIDPVQHVANTAAKRRGRKAVTLLHESHLHALADLRSRSAGVPPTTELADHRTLYEPPARGGYLAATRRTFNSLSAVSEKKAFADEWMKDVTDHIGMDPALQGPAQADARRERTAWARARRDSMVAKAQGLGIHEW
jgi:hypothetical protein